MVCWVIMNYSLVFAPSFRRISSTCSCSEADASDATNSFFIRRFGINNQIHLIENIFMAFLPVLAAEQEPVQLWLSASPSPAAPSLSWSDHKPILRRPHLNQPAQPWSIMGSRISYLKYGIGLEILRRTRLTDKKHHERKHHPEYRLARSVSFAGRLCSDTAKRGFGG